jgi:hypothetical protein
MNTFKEYVEATKRQDIAHFQKMKDDDLFSFIEEITAAGGKFPDNLSVSLKVDGLGARFGKDKSGRIFFESSRSGPIFTPKAFSAFAKQKNATGDSLKRSEHYDDMFDLITCLPVVKNLPEDVKVVCEIFYPPLAKLEEDGITFVTVKYDKALVGKELTIIPLDVIESSTGNEHPDKQRVIADLIASSNDNVKIVSPQLAMNGNINISAQIKPLTQLTTRNREVLKSRLKKDVEEKASLRAIVDATKQQIADYILSHQAILGKDILGKDIEGLVLNINGRLIKITTDAFKASKIK